MYTLVQHFLYVVIAIKIFWPVFYWIGFVPDHYQFSARTIVMSLPVIYYHLTWTVLSFFGKPLSEELFNPP